MRLLPKQTAATAKLGFLIYVKTKGGKTEGRQQQRYLLLKRDSVYQFSLPTPFTIVSLKLKSVKGEEQSLAFWEDITNGPARGESGTVPAGKRDRSRKLKVSTRKAVKTSKAATSKALESPRSPKSPRLSVRHRFGGGGIGGLSSTLSDDGATLRTTLGTSPKSHNCSSSSLSDSDTYLARDRRTSSNTSLMSVDSTIHVRQEMLGTSPLASQPLSCSMNTIQETGTLTLTLFFSLLQTIPHFPLPQ